MPTRVLREGILDSAAVNELSFPAEVFYRRLMSVVDDFGRFDGRPAVLRGRLYSLKLDTVREAEISRWIAECEKVGLIALYSVDAKPYILLLKLGSPRAKESKFPAPPLQAENRTLENASVYGCAQMNTDANGCAQTHTDAPYSGSRAGSGTGSNSGSASGAGSGAPPPARPPDAVVVQDSPANTEEPFDPLRAAQAARNLFEERWKAAGLRKCSRLSAGLQGRLEALLRDAWWAENYPAAIERAGRNPWLREGLGRVKGALDVSEFLFDEDAVRKIVDGVWDQHTGGPSKAPTLVDKASESFKDFLG